MSYERFMGMGYETQPGSCSDASVSPSISGGQRVCFRPRELTIAQSRGCSPVGDICRIGGSSAAADAGQIWCCPAREVTHTDASDTSDGSGGGGSKPPGGNFVSDVWGGITDIFTGGGGTTNTGGGGTTNTGGGSSSGFTSLQEKMDQIGQTVDEAITGAIDEVLPNSEGETEGLNWFERNRGAIMFGGGAISLGFGALWLYKAFGKKGKK